MPSTKQNNKQHRGAVTNPRNVERLADEALKFYEHTHADLLGQRSKEQVAVDKAAALLRGNFTEHEIEAAMQILLAPAPTEKEPEEDSWCAPWDEYGNITFGGRFGHTPLHPHDHEDRARYGEFTDEVLRLKEYYSHSNVNLLNTQAHDMAAQGDITPEEASGLLYDLTQTTLKLNLLCRLAELHVRDQEAKSRYGYSYNSQTHLIYEFKQLMDEWSAAGFEVPVNDRGSVFLFNSGRLNRDFLLIELEQFPLH